MKKLKITGFILLCVLLMTGCEEKNNSNTIISNNEKINTSTMVHEHCTREGSVEDGDANLNYDLYYTGEVLNLLQSEEMIISSTSTVLDEYEQAFKNIDKYYEGLEYYDTKVIRTATSVARNTTINYDKINIANLLAIEGEEDNVIEDGVAKVALWKELAKKFGTTCEQVSIEE